MTVTAERAGTRTEGPGASAGAWSLLLRHLVPVVVFAGAVPLGGWSVPSAWLAAMIVLLLLEGRALAAAKGADAALLSALTAVRFSMSVAYALAAFYIVEFPSIAGKVLATTLIGMAMFAILVRDYRSTGRLMLNLAPMVFGVVVVQVEAVLTVLHSGRAATIATVLGAPTLVLLLFMALRRDLASARARLVDALAAAESSAHAETEFLANMSHEIRTPLTAVIGFADLLDASPELSPPSRSHVQRIVASSQGLLAVVDDILEFSRLDAGKLDLHPRPTEVRSLFEEVVALFEELAADKGLELRLEVEGSPGRLMVDPDRLRQITANLLSNAIKFTPSGSVTLAVGYAAGASRLEATVADTGEGIARDKLDLLFQRFSQVDRSAGRRHGGSGLGLSICRRLVERMGGAIAVVSETGVGSAFSFSIDAPRAAPALLPAATPPDAGPAPVLGREILVVDDLSTNRELVRAMLEAFGHRVTEAADGPEAVALAAARPFDLILLDLQMPGMDGFATARAIRDAQTPNGSTAIVALSADVLPEHVEASREAGMDAHLGKPLRAAALVQTVAEWAGRGTATRRDRAA